MASVDTAKVDEIFAEWDKEDSPGCALGVVHGGELIYARGYGSANLDLGVPISPASVMHVASVSKQFTAISIGILAREGKLSLEDDVRKYVPELPEFGHVIRLRHLIHHTSGLRDQYGLFRLAGWRDDDVQAFSDVLDFAFNHRRLNFEPGSEYSYCNTSYTLMALTVERVSGLKLREFVSKRVLMPLDMTHSHIHDDVTEIVPNRASAYAPRDSGGFKVADSNVEVPGAICVYTSVEDLARWVRNFERRDVAGDVLDDAINPGLLNDGTTQGYGYGLTIGNYRGLRTVSHGGVDSGYRAEMLWFPDVDFGVIVLANLSAIKPGWLARKVTDLYLKESLTSDELIDTPAIELSAEEMEAFSGLYRDERRSLTRRVTVKDGKLMVNGPFGDPMALEPFEQGRFRLGLPPQEIQIQPRADGALEYHELMPSHPTAVFTAAEVATPNAEALSTYAGTYFCSDINTRYTFFVRDGKLIARLPRRTDRELEPTVTDAFSTESIDLVFVRDGRGDITACEVFADRIRHLRFDRER
ncbi:MAG: serine hydrolase domain-containing protein [Nitrolancea sp.]